MILSLTTLVVVLRQQLLRQPQRQVLVEVRAK